jgi:drug/metabolite transporter (DMT)-like permease
VSAAQAAGVAAALVAAALFGTAAVLQAHAVRRFAPGSTGLPQFVLRSLRDPFMLLVLAFYLAGFVLHAVSIWLLPLYLAQAAIALSLPVTALASRRVDQPLGRGQWAAVALVTLGLVLLGAGSGRAGDVVVDGRFAALLVVGVALLLLAGQARRRLGGAALGTLAGLGYAGSAIAVRGVGTPVEAAVVVAALTIPAYGGLAFWVYSLGLRWAPVSSATAPMIVLQTFVPAAVGVLALDDAVRPGWAPAVLAGLLLSTLGAVVLSLGGLRSPGEAATGSGPGHAPPRGPRPRRSP